MTQWPVDAEHGVFVHALYADCEKAGLQPLPDAPIYGCNFKARFGAGVNQVSRPTGRNTSDLPNSSPRGKTNQ